MVLFWSHAAVYGIESPNDMSKLQVQVTVVFLVISYAYGIDDFEQLGKCRKNFTSYGFYYIQENEGVWFPQYRTKTDGNDEYKCHTVYERMYYEDGTELLVDSYYTKGNVPFKQPRMQDYVSGQSRGIMIDDTSVPGNFIPGYGSFRVYNYIVKMTDDFRVRYICADYVFADRKTTTVYIETRKSYPSLSVIQNALAELKKAELYVTLDQIDQTNCTRPTVHDGYIKYT